jgi:rare lipoprotein A (peptidoglycan hydrolase)
VTVPVIDRGPYAGNRVWDLTPATKARLHFPSTGVVWSTR